MNKAGQIKLLIVAFSALALNACVFSSDDSPNLSTSEHGARAATITTPKTAEELVAEQTRSINQKPAKLRDATKSALLADGSEYILMKDGEGNKVESRYFPEGLIVRSVQVKTEADGNVQIFVRAWNGKVEQIELHGTQSPWSSSARELALVAGFRHEPPKKIQPPVNSTTPVNLNQPSITNDVAPSVETTEKK